MRISTNTFYDLGIGQIQKQTSDLFKTQQQISTGRRILTPEDDPVGAARVLEVSQSAALNKQYDTNMGSASSVLALEESQLGSVVSLIQDVRTLAVQAGNATLDDNNLRALATDMRGRYQQLLGLANSTDGNGQYLFSGYRGSTLPFSETAPGNVAYNGDQGQRLMQISPSRQIATSDSGSDVFMRILNGNGTFVTAATTTNTGTGVVSPGTVLDPAAWTAVADKNLTLAFNVDNSVIPPVTTYDVTDTSGNSVFTGVPPVVPYSQTYTSGAAISLRSPPALTDYGIELSIEGSPATGDTFTIAPSDRQQDIFSTIDNLILALERGRATPAEATRLSNDLNTALQNLDHTQATALTVQASVGARMKEIDAVKSTGEDLALQYDQTISGLQDLDYAKAISDLTKQQQALDAAQKSFINIQGMSLFKYI